MDGKKGIKITTKAFGIILTIVGSIGTVINIIFLNLLTLPISIIMLVFGSIILQKRKKAALSDGKTLSDSVLEKFGICLVAVGSITGIFNTWRIHFLFFRYYCWIYYLGDTIMGITDIIVPLLGITFGALMIIKYHKARSPASKKRQISFGEYNRKKLSNGWLCSCGTLNGGEDLFCSVCGKPRPKD